MIRSTGQALALFALTLLLLTLMVLMTVSIGMNAARRADLNNTADATAWAAAVATARTYNNAAVLNRAIIAHYVTMAGIEAQMAYVSEAHNAFNMAGTFFRMFDMTGDPVTIFDAFQGRNDPSGRCPQLTTEVRDASYEMWHASLFFYSPGGAAPPAWPGDNVDGYCQGPPPCRRRRPFARSDGWLQESIIDLEKKAAEELKGAHLAIHELAAIQRATYRELRTEVASGSLARDIAAEARGDDGLQVEGRAQAKAELDSSTRSTSSGTSYAGRWKGYEHGLADTIMGTRPRERLSLMGNPANQDNFTPLFVQLKRFADDAFAAYPGQPFAVSFSHSDVTSDYTWLQQDNEPHIWRRREDPMGPPNPLDPGMGFLYGRAQGGRVVVTYKDACAGGQERRIQSGPPDPTPADPVTGQHYVTLPMGVMIRSAGSEGRHLDYASDHLDGQHWETANGTGPMGCHRTHAHYGATQVDQIHQLDDETLPPEILAFVLSEPDANQPGGKGGHGLWGQPVVPIFLTRRFPFAGDPWALKLHFGFTGTGADLDLQRGNVMTASAAGVAHYHRRGHLGEPPNLMNPFWRATLQPMEVDARAERFDPTFDTRLPLSQRPMMNVLQNDVPQYGDRAEARRAYNQLRQVVHGMERHPGTNTGVVR